MKEIMIAGTGTQFDGKTVAVPNTQRVWSVIKPPNVTDWLFTDPQSQSDLDFETIDCQFTGVVFEKEGRRAEVWAPLEQHQQVIREAGEASKIHPGIKPPPTSEPKRAPSKVITLDSDLDDLDCDDEDEDDEPSFEDWWFGQREHAYDEMERQVAERLKATLLWQGPITDRKKPAGFNFIRNMNS
jgi:hypothetical protein